MLMLTIVGHIIITGVTLESIQIQIGNRILVGSRIGIPIWIYASRQGEWGRPNRLGVVVMIQI